VFYGAFYIYRQWNSQRNGFEPTTANNRKR